MSDAQASEETHLEDELKTLIVTVLELEDIEPDEIGSEDPLFVEGLGLDSLDAIELADKIAADYGVKIEDDSERNVEIFRSVRTLARFIQQHRTEQQRTA